MRLHLAIILLLFPASSGCAGDPIDLSFREDLGTYEEAQPDPSLHPVRIHVPPELSTLATSDEGPGTPCATCHSIEGLVVSMPTSTDDLGGPHAGLRFAHGTNGCPTCHAPTDVTRLHLADGTMLPMSEAMTLCAQCHGPQFRDYEHGSHGGMRGYWDRTRGPRDRNHCIDCHDPHTPRYPAYLPMPPPADRVQPVHATHAHESENPHE